MSGLGAPNRAPGPWTKPWALNRAPGPWIEPWTEHQGHEPSRPFTLWVYTIWEIASTPSNSLYPHSVLFTNFELYHTAAISIHLWDFNFADLSSSAVGLLGLAMPAAGTQQINKLNWNAVRKKQEKSEKCLERSKKSIIKIITVSYTHLTLPTILLV